MPRSSRRPRLTDAERDARRQADRERVEQAARALLTTDGWRRWIKVRASNGLSRYSLRNQLLIAIDCHTRGITPTYIGGFQAFLALNRCVRKGEKAIHILAPVTVKRRDEHGDPTAEKAVVFRAVPVFDVTMTDPLPGREPVPLTPPTQPITGDSHQHLIAPLIAHAATLGYRVEIRELPEHGPAGWCDSAHQQITIAAGPANRQVRILVHELAHAHGLDYQHYGRERCEVLVDCVTYCVLGSLGLDISGETIPYIAGWGEDGGLDAIREYAGTIDTIAYRIETALEPAPDADSAAIHTEAQAA
jgi:hypothetical protein